MAKHHLGNCALLCGRLGTTIVCGHKICDECIARIRAIATDAGVVVDEALIGGELRTLSRRQLVKARKKLEDVQERREIEKARRTA